MSVLRCCSFGHSGDPLTSGGISFLICKMSVIVRASQECSRSGERGSLNTSQGPRVGGVAPAGGGPPELPLPRKPGPEQPFPEGSPLDHRQAHLLSLLGAPEPLLPRLVWTGNLGREIHSPVFSVTAQSTGNRRRKIRDRKC